MRPRQYALTRAEVKKKKRRKHGLTPKRRKWRILRVSLKTHEMLRDMKAHTNVSMVEFVERVVDHIYGGGIVAMQALSFFVLYLNDEPSFVVAAQSADKAEMGMRQERLGQTAFKSVKAVPLGEAKLEDVHRVGTMAILSQLTQISAMLQALLSKGR